MTEIAEPSYLTVDCGAGYRNQLWSSVNGQEILVYPKRPNELLTDVEGRKLWSQEIYATRNYYSMVPTAIRPGFYFNRMARPVEYEEFTGARIEYDDGLYSTKARNQLNILCNMLDEICRTVHPEANNMQMYGHATRNLMMLACTEVEAQWKSVLRANDYQSARWCTNDYFKLCAAMRLNEYEIAFANYPWLEPFSPFSNWSAQFPTSSLPWYDAYNAVKHDSEAEFGKATLLNTFNAVAACAVMLVAQFGKAEAFGKGDNLHVYFDFQTTPNWPWSERYHAYFDAPRPKLGWNATKYIWK